MYKLISFLYERLKFRVGNYAFNDQKNQNTYVYGNMHFKILLLKKLG